MKQKFAVIRDEENNELIIREYSELDKEEMTLLCEETYGLVALQDKLSSGGSQALVTALRTRNFFPPSGYAVRIAEAVAALIEDRSQSAAEIVVDDKDHLLRARDGETDIDGIEENLVEEIDEDSDALDELLEEDGAIPAPASLKIDENEPADGNDDK